MDLKKLKCFIRVAELSSFTHAALTLDLSQSVVSRQVRQLEIELNKHLLQRNGRGVTLTAAGRQLLEHGKGILHQVELAEQALQGQSGIHKGKVTVGMVPTLGKLLTIDLVSAFSEQFPGSSLAIIENLTYWMQKWLILGELDIALLYNPSPNSYLNYQPLWSEKLCLIAPELQQNELPAAITIQDLPKYPLIMPSSQHTLRHRVEVECARHNTTLNIAMEIDAISSLLFLVKRNFGYAILPKNALLCPGRPDGLIAIPIKPTIINRVVLATSAQRHLTPLAQKTIELIQNKIIAGVQT